MIKSIIRRSHCVLLSCGLLFFLNSVFAEEYKIGTYYFPGWTNNAKGLSFPIPWSPIAQYPEKIPSLGWYSDSDPAVLRQQTLWMREYGISYVVFDWYWDGKNSYLEQGLNAFRSSKVPGEMKFSLLWANHYKFPGGMPEFRLMIRYWIARYFKDVDYLAIDGKPAVFIFSIESLEEAAKTIGVPLNELTSIANKLAIEEGLPGIYFIFGSQALEHWVKGIAPKGGASALSAYNYRIGYSGNAASATPVAEGYAQMDAAYRQSWQWILKNSPLPYVMPMTSGWTNDLGAEVGIHDATSPFLPGQFEAHLREAKRLMDLYPEKTKRMGVICCWNEFGEGSYIEPTKKDGFSYLEKVKKVFGSP